MYVAKLLLIALRLTKHQTLGLDVMKPKIMLGFKFYFIFLDMQLCMSFLGILNLAKLGQNLGMFWGEFFGFWSKIFEGTNRTNSGYVL